MHIQDVIDLGHLAQREFLKPGKQGKRFLVAVLDLFEPSAALLLKGRVLFRLLVEADIQRQECADAALLDRVAVAPALVGADELAELRTPVAQVVDAHGMEAQEVEDLV